MGVTDDNCDDGMVETVTVAKVQFFKIKSTSFQTNLDLDYDPRNISHHSRHLCLDERKFYAPSYDVHPRLLDYTIPPAYVVSIVVVVGLLVSVVKVVDKS